MNKTSCLFFSLLIVLAIYVSSATAQSITAQSLEEAAAALKVPGAAAPFVDLPDPDPLPPTPFFGPPPYLPIAPIKLFDNFYFVGTVAVGAFVIDTGDGLAMLDTGICMDDASGMVEDMKKLGLDPSTIKLIFISHEHFDHYGGVQYLKTVCPRAKVAMNLVGWNMLQTIPIEGGYIGPRPRSVDIYLTDGMKIKMGNTTFQIVATPGHSAGCMSFIIPVTDNGEPHMAGIMGGTAVWATQLETRLYKASIEYFKAFSTAAKCDVGLGVHSTEGDFAALRVRKPGEAHPLVIGTEKFDTVYLQKYRALYQYVLDSGKMMPYPGVVAPPGSAPGNVPTPVE